MIIPRRRLLLLPVLLLTGELVRGRGYFLLGTATAIVVIRVVVVVCFDHCTKHNKSSPCGSVRFGDLLIHIQRRRTHAHQHTHTHTSHTKHQAPSSTQRRTEPNVVVMFAKAEDTTGAGEMEG